MNDGEVEEFLKGMGEPKYRAKQVRQKGPKNASNVYRKRHLYPNR